MYAKPIVEVTQFANDEIVVNLNVSGLLPHELEEQDEE